MTHLPTSRVECCTPRSKSQRHSTLYRAHPWAAPALCGSCYKRCKSFGGRSGKPESTKRRALQSRTSIGLNTNWLAWACRSQKSGNGDLESAALVGGG